MLYDREIRLEIKLAEPYPKTGYRGNLNVQNLRIQFSVLKTISQSTNTCTVRIYNLSPTNRDQLGNLGNEINLYAGYKRNGGSQLLFTGTNTDFQIAYNGNDVITELTCSDGEKILTLQTVKVSFVANTQVKTIIQNVADQIGIDTVFFGESENLTFASGYSDQGLAGTLLTDLCNKINMRWTIQNGNLYILKINAGNLKVPYEINKFTGLVGIPDNFLDKDYYLYNELPENVNPREGYKIKSLLRPEILPSDNINLKSERLKIDNLFYVISARHNGDNYDNEFTSTFEVVPR